MCVEPESLVGWAGPCSLTSSPRPLLAGSGHITQQMRALFAMTVVTSGAGGVVDFIGDGGALLSSQGVAPRDQGNVYRLSGRERYVRARVTAPDGTRAWTQAYHVAR